MIVQSSIKPNLIEIQYVKENIARIRLRKDIKEITKEENDEIITMYEYDEVIFDVDNIPNLTQQIENNFELYFNYGQQQMELTKSKEKAKKKIYKLVEKYGLVDLNNNTENASILLTSLMREVETLKSRIKILEE